MKIILKILVSSMIFFSSFIGKDGIGAIIQDGWDSPGAYYPAPPVFVHGMNSSPDAWGFRIDQRTEEVVDYTKTSEKLLKYFSKYYDFTTDPNVELPYLEPFNYQYNTFDSVKWNAYEGYVDKDGILHSGEQYPDGRISGRGSKADFAGISGRRAY